MILSNRLASVSILIVFCAMAAGCSWPGEGENAASASPAIEPPKSGVPFETKEPETFRADLITSSGGIETLVRYARKATNWRVDTFDKETASRSIISTDKQIHIDHRSKTYAEAPSGGGPADRPAYVTDLTQSLLNRKEHAKFEKLGTDGTLERYRVTVDGTTTPFIITYDTATKMVTRQEPEAPLPGGFVFEMRGLTLDVSDDVFKLPSGYRKITWQEFLTLR